MSENTKIEWADDSVNFWSGCSKVSSGCLNCYAETLSNRNMGSKSPNGKVLGDWGPGAPRRLHESAFDTTRRINARPWICNLCGKPSKSNRRDSGSCLNPACSYQKGAKGSFHRRRVFALSMGDFWDGEVNPAWRGRALDAIWQAQDVDWLIVTKRPENIIGALHEVWDDDHATHGARPFIRDWIDGKPWPHVMLIASCENQTVLEKRVPQLINVPAAAYGLSCEPLLTPLLFISSHEFKHHNLLTGVCRTWNSYGQQKTELFPRINWVIAGCESGPRRRGLDCYPSWANQILFQCHAAGVPCFHKQMGIDGKVVHNMAQWPLPLRVRQFYKPLPR